MNCAKGQKKGEKKPGDKAWINSVQKQHAIQGSKATIVSEQQFLSMSRED